MITGQLNEPSMFKKEHAKQIAVGLNGDLFVLTSFGRIFKGRFFSSAEAGDVTYWKELLDMPWEEKKEEAEK